jgi:hypothetical protein
MHPVTPAGISHGFFAAVELGQNVLVARTLTGKRSAAFASAISKCSGPAGSGGVDLAAGSLSPANRSPVRRVARVSTPLTSGAAAIARREWRHAEPLFNRSQNGCMVKRSG